MKLEAIQQTAVPNMQARPSIWARRLGAGPPVYGVVVIVTDRDREGERERDRQREREERERGDCGSRKAAQAGGAAAAFDAFVAIRALLATLDGPLDQAIEEAAHGFLCIVLMTAEKLARGHWQRSHMSERSGAHSSALEPSRAEMSLMYGIVRLEYNV
jgi:hypothetical protein